MNRRGLQLIAPPNKAGGFTLLEAIVAMVIFTMGAFALYGWLSTNVITLERIRSHQEQEVAFASALDLIRRSNPMQAPTGRRAVGDLVVTWTSRQVVPPRPNVFQGGTPSVYLVGLYTVYVTVTRDGKPVGKFYVRQIGWKQTRAVVL